VLAHSEAAVYLISEAPDWGVVPRTEPHDGAADEVPEAGYRTVLGGEARSPSSTRTPRRSAAWPSST
jgi:hypothetical protein